MALRPLWLRFGVALAAPLLAFVLQSALWPILPPSPHLFFYPAIFVAAWTGGVGPGALATAVSVFLIAFRFLPPTFSLAIEAPQDALDLAIFSALSLMITALLARTRTSSDAAHTAKHAAEDANAAKDDVIALVSHDLRNPIHVIAMSAAELTRMLGTPGTQANRALAVVARVERSARRASSLVNRVLDAQAPAGRLALHIMNHSVRSLVEETRDFAPLAEAAALRFDTDVALEQTVICDRERTIEVLANLVDNAIKFTPAGGSVTVRAALDGKTVRFEVRDTGPGIPEEARARVFDRYWKAAKVSSGMGLGLYIAKRIVEAQGGTMRIESSPGNGSVFSFTLPTSSA